MATRSDSPVPWVSFAVGSDSIDGLISALAGLTVPDRVKEGGSVPLYIAVNTSREGATRLTYAVADAARATNTTATPHHEGTLLQMPLETFRAIGNRAPPTRFSEHSPLRPATAPDQQPVQQRRPLTRFQLRAATGPGEPPGKKARVHSDPRKQLVLDGLNARLAAHYTPHDGDGWPPASVLTQDEKRILAERLAETADEAVAQWVREERGKNVYKMLDDVLGIYASSDFLGMNHLAWIKTLPQDELVALGNTVRLVVPDYMPLDNPAARAAVRTYAVLRHPVHMPHTTLLNPGRLKAVLGYEESDVNDLEWSGIITAPVRFAMVGKVRVRYGRRPKAGGDPNHDMWIINAWGVHLGDQPRFLQADRRYVVHEPYGKFIQTHRCYDLMRVNSYLISRAVQHVLDTDENAKTHGVLVMWNGLGLGVWIDVNAVDETLVRDYWRDLGVALAHETNTARHEKGQPPPQPPPVLVWQPFGRGGRTDAYLYKHDIAHEVTTNGDPCGGYLPYIVNTNHINPQVDPRFLPGDRVVIVLNAWDDWSFIGNGGMSDPTLDGWVVTGGCQKPSDDKISTITRKPQEPGRGQQGEEIGWGKSAICWHAASTAYLHNVFFNPQVLDPDRMLVTNGLRKRMQRDVAYGFGFFEATDETLDAFTGGAGR